MKDSKTKLIRNFDPDEIFDESDFLSDLKIDMSNFNDAVVGHSNLYYKYGKVSRIGSMILEKAKLNVENSKKELEQTLAGVAEKIRAERDANDEKSTVDQIRNLALRSPEYRKALRDDQKLREEFIEIQYEVSILELAEKIFSKRTNLLTTLGWSMSSEHRSDVEIKAPMNPRDVEKDIDAKRRRMIEVMKNSRRSRRRNN